MGNGVPRGDVGKLDVEQLQQEMVEGDIEPGKVYAALQGMGIVHGPAMQVLRAVHRGRKQVLAELGLPEVVERTQGEYVLHPSLVDGALQATVGLMEFAGGSGSEGRVGKRLPYALEEMRILSGCGKQMWAWVRYARGSQRGDAVEKLDIDLCDRAGQVCVQMRGFSTRLPDRVASIGSKLSSVNEYLLARPEWQKRAVDTSQIEYVEQHIILCDVLKSTAEKLQGWFPNKQCICLEAEKAKNIAHRYSEYALGCFERMQAILKNLTGKTLVQIVIAGDQEAGHTCRSFRIAEHGVTGKSTAGRTSDSVFGTGNP